MQKIRHLVKTQLFRLSFGTMQRDGLIFRVHLKTAVYD